MTDSTIDGNSGNDSFELGPDVDELFGGIESLPETESVDRNESANPDDDAVEDVTAADVFDQLRTEVETTEADSASLLEDDTPDDIIERADEPVEVEESIDDLLADEAELESLLLTGRTEGEEFHWVETPSEDGIADGTDTEAAGSDDAGSDDGVEAESSDGDRSPSIPKEEIEAFTTNGPGIEPTTPSTGDDPESTGRGSIAIDTDQSSESSTDSGGDRTTDSAAERPTDSTDSSADRTENSGPETDRNRSKSEKAGGLYARLRSKLSDVV